MLSALLVFSELLAADPRDLGELHPRGKPLHAVVIGDFGSTERDSGFRQVAAAIAGRHKAAPFDIGLTVGDNFYPTGVRSVRDPLWSVLWEQVYGLLRIPFFATLGNHDYYGNEQAQVDYTSFSPSKTWKMPYRYYTFIAGPVRFFAIDTDEDKRWHSFGRPWSDTQADWLDARLAASDACWKIVYGHHPIFSDGKHGDTRRLQSKLLPILQKHSVAAYIAGHDHDLQFFEGIEPKNIHFFVTGGGGKDTRDIAHKRARFAKGMFGFLELNATSEALNIRFRDTAGRELIATGKK